MAVGKKTGGRQKGTPNKATAEKAAKVEASGLTPLDYLISVMRDITLSRDERMDAAKAAAPYVHPRLSQVDSRAQVTHNYVARIPEPAKSADEWQKQHSPTHPSIQ